MCVTNVRTNTLDEEEEEEEGGRSDNRGHGQRPICLHYVEQCTSLSCHRYVCCCCHGLVLLEMITCSLFSLDFEECAHKILKMNIKPGQEVLESICVCVSVCHTGSLTSGGGCLHDH